MRNIRLTWGLAACAVLALAPIDSLSVAGAQQHSVTQHSSHNAGPLAEAVRRATERYRDSDVALAAGYVLNGGCVSGPEEGAMGVHLVNPALFDGSLDVNEPEALVYEPRRNGRLQLVAAEYIAPAEPWHMAHPGVQPELAGHLLHFAAGPNRYGAAAFYELHVWAWKENPRGTFADWNPNVSCSAWTGTLP
jgi:hypothetical protein